MDAEPTDLRADPSCFERWRCESRCVCTEEKKARTECLEREVPEFVRLAGDGAGAGAGAVLCLCLYLV